MKLILSTLIIVLLGGLNYGCESFLLQLQRNTGNYNAAVKSWIKVPVSQVIESWGEPTSVTTKDNGLIDYEWYWWDSQELTQSTKSNGEITKTQVVRCITILRVDGTGLVVKSIPTRDSNERCDLRPPLPSRK